jgi:ent-kaurene synthase
MLSSVLPFLMRVTGVHFIGRNLSVATSEQIVAPIGFNITFPGLLNLAIGMDLELPVRQTYVDAILQLREVDMKRFVDG